MRINHQISNQNINYKGLYKSLGIIERTTGRANFNKVTVSIRKYAYHPFKNEKIASISEAINKHTKGRVFALWEVDHGHQEGVYYIMNHITLAESVKDSEKEILLKQGYSETPLHGIQNHDEFMKTYNNESYGTMDVMEFGKDYIDNFLKKNF